ncbi:MAG TPA: YCF48-related protein [Armatimonadota bacterium]|jgi:photosystem II stability/assembly factor-like uncharacterized protein
MFTLINAKRVCTQAVVALCAAAHAGVPAGLGGFEWRSANPQPNDLYSVAAPPAGAGGAGLMAVGDASTFLFRSLPSPTGAGGGWLGGRGRTVRNNVAYRGLAVARNPLRVAIAADDGSVLLGDGRVMLPRGVSDQALTAAAWARNSKGERTLAVGGRGGGAFAMDDATEQFTRSALDTALPGPPDFQAIRFGSPAGAGGEPGVNGVAAVTLTGPNGTRGALLRSPDAGHTWLLPRSAPSADAWWDVAAMDPATAFAVGLSAGAGIVAVTRDGGVTWTSLATVDPSMRAIAAFDKGALLVAGAAGLFLAPQGVEFVARPEPVEDLRAPIPLFALDTFGPDGWAVGQGGVIFHSVDSGVNWTAYNDLGKVARAQLETYQAIQYLSDTDIVTAGTGGAILRSRDGGRSFQPEPSPATETLFALGAMGARNAGIGANAPPGLALGARRTVAAYDSPTAAWALQGHVPNADYRAVTMIGPSASVKIWAVGAGGAIVHSVAGSPVWDEQLSGTPNGLNAVQAVVDPAGGYNVFAAGEGGVVLRSADGLHWGPANPDLPSPLPAPYTTSNLRGLFFTTPALGFVVGDGGVIGRTDDGGKSWSAVTPDPAASNLLAVSGVPAGAPATEVYAVGEHQTALRSIDGRTWERMPLPLPNGPDIALRAVQAPAPGVVYVAGDDGHVFTFSGGAWLDVGFTLADTVEALRMTSPTAGMAVLYSLFSGPRIAFTADGFATVTEAALPADARTLAGGDMFGSDAAAVGAGGAVLRSFNAASAAPDFISEASDVRAVASPAPGVYVAAGAGSLLMRSADNGVTWQRLALPDALGPDVTLRGVGFAAADALGNAVGYAVGARGGGTSAVVLKSPDSGRTWQDITPNLGADDAGFNAVAALSGMALAAASNGSVFLYDGSSWTPQRPIPGFTGAWLAVSATDSRWYLAGERGALARFPDFEGQPQWQTLIAGTYSDVFSVNGPATPAGAAGSAGGGRSLRDDIRGFALDPGGLLITEVGGNPMWGDVNRDASINGVDARDVLQCVGGAAAADPTVYWYGDIDPPASAPDALPGDGVLTINDVTRLLRVAAGL